jgi:phospholipid transport system substrate-binding protein
MVLLNVLMAFFRLASATLLVAFALPLAAQAQTAGSPDELIRSIATGVLDEVKADRTLQTGDIERLNSLLDRRIMPHVNFQRMTALAVGRFWRSATPDQQKVLMAEFRRLLLLTYADAVRQVSDTSIQMKPSRARPEDDEVVVRTALVRPGKEPIQLDYRLERIPGGWRIFDINVLGLWLVENYRTQFAQVIGASGIDGLIQLMKEKNTSLASAAQAKRTTR